MTTDLFDNHLRAVRRDRAARMGPDMFLLDRSFDECLDRLRDIARSFDRALLIGCPSPDWPRRLAEFAAEVEVVDPGALFAARSQGTQIQEGRQDFGLDRYDLCMAIGTLDTVNDLPLALGLVARALQPDSPLIGAIAGGDTLPTLRASLIEAGRKRGRIVARTHPRIDAATLGQLLAAAGFSMPVVDLDRVRLRYENIEALVQDLRAMAATSVLAQRAPAFSKSEWARLREAFLAQATDGRVEETVEILHFLAWTHQSRQAPH